MAIAPFGNQSCYHWKTKNGGFSVNIWQWECFQLECVL